MNPLIALGERLREALAGALPEADVAPAAALPRGARSLAGLGRPLLVGVTRWPAVPPSGVVVAGQPEAIAAVLGIQLPPRPEPAPEAEVGRRASDHPEQGEPAASPVDAGDDAVPARRWTDRAALALEPEAARLAVPCIETLAEVVGLPFDTTQTRAHHAEVDAEADALIGTVPDALSFEVVRGEHAIRIIVITAVLVAARIAAGAVASGTAATVAAAPAAAAPEEETRASLTLPAMGRVPLPLQARLGRASLPLATVMSLQPGALVELDAASSAPLELVSGGVAIARGELQLDDDGLLEFEVSERLERPNA